MQVESVLKLCEAMDIDEMSHMGVKWYLNCFEIAHKRELMRLNNYRWLFPVGYELEDKRYVYLLAFLLKVANPSQLFQRKGDFQPIENLRFSSRNVLAFSESDWQELIATPR